MAIVASTPCIRWPAPNATLVTDHADDRAAQPHVEAVEQERALDFLAHAAGGEHHEREQPRVARRAQQFLQRVVGDGVERRRPALDRQQHDRADGERRKDQRDADGDFARDRTPTRTGRRAAARRAR